MGPNQVRGRFPDGQGDFIALNPATPEAANLSGNLDITGLVINEIAANEDPDWIELYNAGTKSINLSGAYLSDTSSTPKKWQFPIGTTLEARQFLVIYANDSQLPLVGTQLQANFKLSNSGEEVVVTNALGQLHQKISFPALLSGQSYARIPNATGNFQVVNTQTKHADNATQPPQPNPNAGNIVINEINSFNSSGLLDEEGEAADWIELYNKGTLAVDLAGLKLQDAGTTWIFPAVTIQPSGYLTIFASGKNQREGTTLHTNFEISATGERIRFLNRDDQIVSEIIVPGLSADQSYGRDPNGQGAFRIFAVPTPSAENRTIALAPNPQAANIVLNEISSNTFSSLKDEDQEPQDWIELFNKGTVPVNCEGLKLEDEAGVWVFPALTINAGEYKVILASGKNRRGPTYHTNFKLAQSGEKVRLLNKDNSLIDEVVIPALAFDETYGRYPNGTGAWRVYAQATVGLANLNTTIAANPNARFITVNEVSSANDNAILDNDGEATDWIELFNKGIVSVDLQGLKLQDDAATWVFPSITLNPGQYLLVFASGKDRRVTQLHTNFKLSAVGGILRFLNKDNAVIEELNVPSQLPDESYGRSPNATGDYTLFRVSTPNAVNQTIVIPPNPDAVNIVFNEILSSNTIGILDEDGDAQDWIELYNKGGVAVNLGGLKLKDDTTTWVFPSVNLAPASYLVVFASNKDRRAGSNLHTNFKIDQAGENLKLLNKDNSVIDEVALPGLVINESYGRYANGTGAFRFYQTPSPRQPNPNIAIAPNALATNIVINEISPSNKTVLDFQGKPEDWIELFNKGNVSVNLQGLKLRDQSATWTFPSVTLAPGNHLLVFASGNNETINELHTNFKLDGFGEQIQLLNTDYTLLQEVTTPGLTLDETLGRYPNWLGAFRLYAVGTPNAVNPDIKIDPNPLATNIVINEIIADNATLLADEDGTRQDIIEIANKGSVAVNLQGLRLQDSADTWVLPSVNLNPQQFLTVFASNKDRTGVKLHTNFNIANEGETIRLLNRDTSVLDTVSVVVLTADQGFGRIPDFTGNFQVIAIASPGAKNKPVLSKLRLQLIGPQNGFVNIESSAPGTRCTGNAQYPLCYDYPQGTQIKLKPNLFLSAARLAQWSLPQCPNANECLLSLDQPETQVTATFARAVEMKSPANGQQLQSPQLAMQLDDGERVNEKIIIVESDEHKIIF